MFKSNGVQFKSLSESIDTTTSTGKLVFNVIGAIAEFKQAIIVERTKAGLKAARARGIKGGRRQKLTGKPIKLAKSMFKIRQYKNPMWQSTLIYLDLRSIDIWTRHQI